MNSESKQISYLDAVAAQKNGRAIIVDVREPAEFRDGHIPYAINLPSTEATIQKFATWNHLTICLVCQTGNRAQILARELEVENR